jgi:hypothetical protein
MMRTTWKITGTRNMMRTIWNNGTRNIMRTMYNNRSSKYDAHCIEQPGLEICCELSGTTGTRNMMRTIWNNRESKYYKIHTTQSCLIFVSSCK